jgi:hypothetical protein
MVPEPEPPLRRTKTERALPGLVGSAYLEGPGRAPPSLARGTPHTPLYSAPTEEKRARSVEASASVKGIPPLYWSFC